MAYEMEEIQQSQEIFYLLLKEHEIKEENEKELFRVYTQNNHVMNLVKSQATAAESQVERYGDVIYLIPKEDNEYLGFTKQELKAQLCRSNATDKDYYLSQFVILVLLTEFYDGQGSSSKSREYMKVGELLNLVSDYMEPEEEEKTGLAFINMLEAYSALRSDEHGSKARTTKEGFVYHVLQFLQKQGLIHYVERDEMIMTTKKLDRFMDWNLLNQNNYQRVLRVLGVAKDE